MFSNMDITCNLPELLALRCINWLHLVCSRTLKNLHHPLKDITAAFWHTPECPRSYGCFVLVFLGWVCTLLWNDGPWQQQDVCSQGYPTKQSFKATPEREGKYTTEISTQIHVFINLNNNNNKYLLHLSNRSLMKSSFTRASITST